MRSRPLAESSGSPHARASRLGLSYAAIFGGPGAVQSFAALWLQSEGMLASQIGPILGIPLCGRVAAGMLVGLWAQRFRHLWVPVALLSLATAAAAAGLMLSGGFWSRLLGWSLICTCIGSCTPLLDSLNLQQARGRPGGFSRSRSAGALAYLCGSLALGGLASRFGIDRMFPLWALLSAMSAAMLLPMLAPGTACPRRLAETHPPPGRAPQTATGGRPGVGLLVLALAAAGLVQASHGLNALVMLDWHARGYGPRLCAMLWQVGAVSDIAFLWLLSRYPMQPAALLVLGAAAASIRWAAFALSPSLALLFGLQTLHALGATGTTIAIVQLVDRLVPERRSVLAQVLSWAVMSGLCKGLVTLGCGSLYQSAGVQGFWVMGALASIGCMLAILLQVRMRQPRGVPSNLSVT